MLAAQGKERERGGADFLPWLSCAWLVCGAPETQGREAQVGAAGPETSQLGSGTAQCLGSVEPVDKGP